MIENGEVSPVGEEAARLTFADVPFEVVGDIARNTHPFGVVQPEYLLDRGVPEELVTPLVQTHEVPLFPRDPSSPLVETQGIRGSFLLLTMAGDLDLHPSYEDRLFGRKGVVLGLKEILASFASPHTVAERVRYSGPYGKEMVELIEGLEIDLPTALPDKGEGSGGVLIGSGKDLY